MSGNVPPEIAERLSDVHGGDIPKWALERAREDLTERLHANGTAGGLTLRDLLDSDMNGPRGGFAVIELTNLLLADSGERAAMADTYVSGVIERFLSVGIGEEAVTEQAEAILADRSDE